MNKTYFIVREHKGIRHWLRTDDPKDFTKKHTWEGLRNNATHFTLLQAETYKMFHHIKMAEIVPYNAQ